LFFVFNRGYHDQLIGLPINSVLLENIPHDG
jgi:hypothetical protein